MPRYANEDYCSGDQLQCKHRDGLKKNFNVKRFEKCCTVSYGCKGYPFHIGLTSFFLLVGHLSKSLWLDDSTLRVLRQKFNLPVPAMA